MSKNNIEYAEKNTLPETIEDKDVTVQISLKIEGDLLKAIRVRAKELDKPYQTIMKQLLREKLGMSGEQENLATQFKRLEEEVEELKAGYRQLAGNRRKLSDMKKPSRATRSRAKRVG